MAQWPASLPKTALAGTLNEEPEENVHRFRPSVGPTLDWLKSSAASRFMSFQMSLTNDQKETLDTFFETTASYGATEFTAPNPGDATETDLITVKFAERPTFVKVTRTHWSASMRWYKMPA